MIGDGRTFVDTNVLVYAYAVESGRKQVVARSAIENLWRDQSGALSTQVLQEFYATVTRKLARPLDRSTARGLIAEYAAWPVYSIQATDVLMASQVEEQHQLSFWDGLIIVAAQQLGARRLLSEDMQHGRRVGSITIENPFLL